MMLHKGDLDIGTGQDEDVNAADDGRTSPAKKTIGQTDMVAWTGTHSAARRSAACLESIGVSR